MIVVLKKLKQACHALGRSGRAAMAWAGCSRMRKVWQVLARPLFSFFILVLEAMGAVLAGIVILMVLLVWRVSQGPLPLDGVQPYILSALGELAAPYEVALGRTALDWAGSSTSLGFSAKDVALYDPEGHVLAVLPEVEIGISLPALLFGRVAPTTIVLVGPDLRAQRNLDGSINLRLAGDTRSSTSESVLVRWINEMGQAPSTTSSYGSLRNLEISAAKLTVQDNALGMVWRMPRMDLSLQRDAAGLRGGVSMQVAVGNKASTVTGNVFYDRAQSLWRSSLDLDRFNPAELARLSPKLHDLAKIDLPLAGRVESRWKQVFGLTDLRFDFSAGAGQVKLPDGKDTQGAVTSLRNVDVRSVRISGGIDRVGKRADISLLDMQFGQASRVVLKAEAAREANAENINLALSGKLENIKAQDLPHYWPAFAAKGARDWVVKNITDGGVRETSIDANLMMPLATPEQVIANQLSGRMLLEDVEAHYFRPMPPAQDVLAEAVFDLDSFRIKLLSGRVDKIVVPQAQVNILGLRDSSEWADITVVASGAVADQLALIDRKPLGYASRFGLVPAKAKGEALTTARFVFPLFGDLPIEYVAVSVLSKMSKVALPSVVAGQPLSDGELTLKLDGAGMEVAGTGKIGVVPAQFVWKEPFIDSRGSGTEISFTGTLDEKGREQFSVAWPEVVAGQVAAQGVYKSTGSKMATLTAQLDFAKASINLPWVSWVKPEGQSLAGIVDVAFANGNVAEVRKFEAKAKDVSFDGKIDFAKNSSKWTSVTLNKVQVPGSAVKGQINKKADGSYQMSFNGSKADIGALFPKESTDEENAESAALEPIKPPAMLTPMTIKFDIAELATGQGRKISGARGMLEQSNRGWHQLDVTGRMASGKPLELKLLRGKQGRVLRVAAEDAGEMLATLHVVENVHGGRILLEGFGKGDGPVDVVANIYNFRHLNPKTLQKIAELAKPEGAEALARSEGVEFKRLKAKLTYDDDKVMLHDAKLAGDLLGLSLSGPIDLYNKRLDLQGTIVPLYGVNSLVSGIPVIGWILTGGEGGGIFAATYSMTGALKNPSVNVNPLSILAPGFLRNIFFVD
jgi:hypothetical protein